MHRVPRGDRAARVADDRARRRDARCARSPTGAGSASCSARSSSPPAAGGSTCSGGGNLSDVARKLPGFRRELDARALFSVAYGEVASSIYFALGVIAAYALGFTPLVLLGVGVLFLVVSLSYAEGTAALPETGGAATFVRRAFNDLARLRHRLGALPRLPDRDRALGALPAALPRRRDPGARARPQPVGRHRRGARDRGRRAIVRLVRRPSLYGVGIVDPRARPPDAAPPRRARVRARLLAARAHARHVARHASRAGTDSRSRSRSRCSRSPGSRRSRTSPRRRAGRASTCRARCSAAIATVVTRLRRDRGRRALGVPRAEDGARRRRWVHAPLLGVADQHRARSCPGDPRRRASLLRRHHRAR